MQRITSALLLAAAITVSGTLNAQSSFNPTIAAQGFNVFTKSAVQFSAGDTHGPVATGGDVILAGSTIVSMNYSGYYPNGWNNTSNYGLVIGGRVWYNSGNQTQLNNGQLLLAATTGTNIYTINASAGTSQVQFAAGAQNSNPNIQSNSRMPLGANGNASGLNFNTTFSAFTNYSSIINNYPTTHGTSSAINFLSMPRTTGGGSVTMNLVGGKVNYLTLTGAQFAAMESSGITYNFNRTLDSTTVVVFNVTATGTYNWSAPAFGGISDNSLGDARFILFNFPTASRINIIGGRSTIGSILAPGAAIYKTGGNNAAGTIIADTFSMQYGEVHYAPFAGWLPGTSTALAVQDLGLQGLVTGENVQLTWKAAGIAAGAGLRIERSLDGERYSTVATPAAAEAGRWSEPAPLAQGRAYYRIRVDEAGSAARYSAVWRADFSSASAGISLAPMPFSNTLSVRNAGGAFSWKIYDIRGMLQQHGTCEGDCQIGNATDLPAGTYIINVRTAGAETTQRIIKQ